MVTDIGTDILVPMEMIKPDEFLAHRVLSWRESYPIRLQNKIFGNSSPQNLKYDSIPAFCRLSLTQKF